MRKTIKHSLIERVSRIFFVKTELNWLVLKSLQKNRFQDPNTRLNSSLTFYTLKSKKNSVSNMQLYCKVWASQKITNKKLRLSRFGLNFLALYGRVPGISKRGW